MNGISLDSDFHRLPLTIIFFLSKKRVFMEESDLLDVVVPFEFGTMPLLMLARIGPSHVEPIVCHRFVIFPLRISVTGTMAIVFE